MTIRDYFDNIDTWEEEEEVYAFYENDEEQFNAWAAEHNIDLLATQTVLGEEVLVLDLWAYDMMDE